MKILHINDFPADASGGAEVVMTQTIELLRSHGHQVETFTAADLGDAPLTAFRYLDNDIARARLADRLAAVHPNVVHLHNYYHILSPGILAELDAYKQRWPVRVVMTAHDYHLICPNSGGSVFRWWTGRRAGLKSARLASLSYLMSRCWDHRGLPYSTLKLLQHLWHYRWKARHRVIDRLICPSRFVEDLLSTTKLSTSLLPHPLPGGVGRHWQEPARDERLTFVFAGRIEPEKGLLEFLQALPTDFPDRLTIIGDGADLTRCRKVAADRGWRDRVTFLGRLPRGETLARIAESHVLVQPSRVLETYGLTLIEALTVGVNVLASDRGALREIVEDSGVGFLYDIDAPGTLRAQLDIIRSRHAARTLNRFNITPFLEHRSPTRYLDGLLRLYQHDSDQRAAAA